MRWPSSTLVGIVPQPCPCLFPPYLYRCFEAFDLRSWLSLVRRMMDLIDTPLMRASAIICDGRTRHIYSCLEVMSGCGLLALASSIRELAHIFAFAILWALMNGLSLLAGFFTSLPGISNLSSIVELIIAHTVNPAPLPYSIP
jgi:hypothetical protein